MTFPGPDLPDETLAGPGPSRALAREVDWRATPLGPVGRWPEALRAAVRLCFAIPTPVAVFCGPEYTLVHNDGYLAFLGGKERWAMGRPAREVWAEVWAALAPEFDLVLHGGGSVSHEDAPYTIQRHGRPEESFFTFSLTPIRDATGRVCGIFNLAQETSSTVSALRRTERELTESDRRKTEFLAVLSHELRNPLAPIRNSIVLLENVAPGSGTARRAMEILRRQSEHLTRLVDDLLDLSRITHGKIEVKRVRADARELVRRAYLDAKGLFEARDVALLLSEPDEPLWVDADPARFAQMIGNLLHNALKFTPPAGRVEVSVSRRGEACEVTVSDTGQGLEAADLERIFDPFRQAERARAGSGGLGLGLALVKQLATKHGGAIRAHSDGAGRGARFTLSLPLAAAPAAQAGDRAAPGPAGAPLSILIVEDNEDAASTLADLLSLGGHAVSTAATGGAGLEAMAARPPDVLICDVGLPDMSGHEVIRKVRAAEDGRHVFAMALTGYAQPQDREAALSAGFDAHLPKPPPLEALEALLRQAQVQRRP